MYSTFPGMFRQVRNILKQLFLTIKKCSANPSNIIIFFQKSDMDTMETRYFESNSQGLINDLRNELHILRDRERVLLQTITSQLLISK